MKKISGFPKPFGTPQALPRESLGDREKFARSKNRSTDDGRWGAINPAPGPALELLFFGFFPRSPIFRKTSTSFKEKGGIPFQVWVLFSGPTNRDNNS